MTRLHSVLVAKSASCAEALLAVEDAVTAELQRRYLDRRLELLIFLYKERSMYSFALGILQELEGLSRIECSSLPKMNESKPLE